MKPMADLQLRSHAVCCILLLAGATQLSAQRAGSRPFDVSASEELADSPAHLAESAFMQEQLRHGRVRLAERAASPRIVGKFEAKGLRHPAAEIYLRAFKYERGLEVWVRPVGEARFHLLETYPICALAGDPGPKRRQGDEQVPEGFYTIDLFNPVSAYHLSLRIDYPNQRDRIVNRGGRMGGDIFIHGGCLSIGCIAVTDAGIQEIYWLAVEARAMGQRRIPVHIFPARPGTIEMRRMAADFAARPELLDFWRSLEPGYHHFQRNRTVPEVSVDARGRYYLTGDGR